MTGTMACAAGAGGFARAPGRYIGTAKARYSQDRHSVIVSI